MNVKPIKILNFNAEQQIDMGGFCVSTFDYIFRWLIRGDTLCKVIIPENEKIYKTMTACAICGYIKTALKVCEDKVNKDNVDTAIIELENFCTRRNNENFLEDVEAIENVKLLRNHLLEIKNRR